MKNEKHCLPFLNNSFSLFNIFTVIIACCSPLFYLYKDEKGKLNGFEYFAEKSSWNILMIFFLIFLLLSAFFSLLAMIETKIDIKRKRTELGLTACLIETFLYTVYAFGSLQGMQTTLAPFSLFFALLIYVVYSILIDYI